MTREIVVIPSPRAGILFTSNKILKRVQDDNALDPGIRRDDNAVAWIPVFTGMTMHCRFLDSVEYHSTRNDNTKTIIKIHELKNR